MCKFYLVVVVVVVVVVLVLVAVNKLQGCVIYVLTVKMSSRSTHATKAQGGSGGIAPLSVNLGPRWREGHPARH